MFMREMQADSGRLAKVIEDGCRRWVEAEYLFPHLVNWNMVGIGWMPCSLTVWHTLRPGGAKSRVSSKSFLLRLAGAGGKDGQLLWFGGVYAVREKQAGFGDQQKREQMGMVGGWGLRSLFLHLLW